ncbi:MAG: hypothetical protein CVU53_03350 [Deltaproteobacteria bacterium HGW-Deltaproteobacteria-11]|nr:MAG: hypothetical protein CVU53_03350 [Deltaproteobacteria bacterium HGW-Deltaproteobacteria-11]
MDRQRPFDNASRKDRDQVCRTCLYYHREPNDPQEHCARLARFVDHAIHAASRDCDYWSLAPSPI